METSEWHNCVSLKQKRNFDIICFNTNMVWAFIFITYSCLVFEYLIQKLPIIKIVYLCVIWKPLSIELIIKVDEQVS